LVEEPTIEQTVDILKGVRPRYEAHHQIRISDEALSAAARLAARYVPDRFLPDKAIDLMDEAASRVRMYKAPYATSLRETFRALKSTQREREQAVVAKRFDDALGLRHRELDLERKLEQLRRGWQELAPPPVVNEEDITEVVAMWTGIPLQRLQGEETTRLLEMEDYLHKRVVGQEEPVQAIAKAVRRARTGLKDPRRPIGTFMFLGPTGVGKTLLAKSLAEFLFGSEDALIKLDMSEFMERHNVSRLVGAPPGYIGYEEGGQLTEAVRRRPYCVVLLDEVEKAHPEVFNMLLQIMEDGNLSDAKGRRIDFRNTILIMTSNVGAGLIKHGGVLGFAVARNESQQRESEYEAMKEQVMEALKRTFRPEFLNRLDGIMVFRSLTREQITAIVDLELNRVYAQLTEHNITLQVTAEVKEVIARAGYDSEYGARPLRRVIQDRIEDRLSEGMLSGEFKAGDTVVVMLGPDERLDFEVRPSPATTGEPIRSVKIEPARTMLATPLELAGAVPA
jgi:ATP-dependent Clp protease ATP-binding subunit ClpC